MIANRFALYGAMKSQNEVEKNRPYVEEEIAPR